MFLRMKLLMLCMLLTIVRMGSSKWTVWNDIFMVKLQSFFIPPVFSKFRSLCYAQIRNKLFCFIFVAVRKTSAPYNCWYAHRQLTFAVLFILYSNCVTLGDEIIECKTTMAKSHIAMARSGDLKGCRWIRKLYHLCH